MAVYYLILVCCEFHLVGDNLSVLRVARSLLHAFLVVCEKPRACRDEGPASRAEIRAIAPIVELASLFEQILAE
ncbi:hypothetical protein [Magnetofaba australis]|uniref:hypothetical protein n=1 Tax=Magnetofaba australis TaxID=1472297 RepID=UPI000A19F97B|nr:hypothetical protein [Magnetofaba australis]